MKSIAAVRCPRSLHQRIITFYDAVGSRIFEDITRLREYYPTRTERSILASCSDAIIAAACPNRSGNPAACRKVGKVTASKSTILLDSAVRRQSDALRTGGCILRCA